MEHTLNRQPKGSGSLSISIDMASLIVQKEVALFILAPAGLLVRDLVQLSMQSHKKKPKQTHSLSCLFLLEYVYREVLSSLFFNIESL